MPTSAKWSGWNAGTAPAGADKFVGLQGGVNVTYAFSQLFANPTGSLGVSAVNGTAVTAMRSDASPAINQTAAFAFSNLQATVATTLTLGSASLGSNVLSATGLVNFGSAGSASAPTLSVGNQTTGFHSVSTTGFGLDVNGAVKLDFGITAANTWTFAATANPSVVLSGSGGLQTGTNGISFSGRSYVLSTVDGNVQFGNNAGTNTTTISFPTATATPTLQLGAADAATAVAQTTRVQSVVAGTTASNGANWTFIGSLPTGTGTSGDIIFQTGVKTGSGTTQGTATTALTIKGETQQINASAPIQLKSYTVSGLPSASTSGAGSTAFVTDANTTFILGLGVAVVGGGSNKVPVYSDGTNWIVG